MNDDIAVIGVGCRFPGADNLKDFWRVLVNGENHVVDIPPERWNNDAFYSEDRSEKGKLYTKKAALINHFDEFDNKLFGISDNEAQQIDPQQKFVLECVHMAMEDGGITRKQLNGSLTGVYIGAMASDYNGMFDFDLDDVTTYTATGTNSSIISARVSYVYNLQGPSMVIDTACSSSMTSVHLGCQAIRTGDCEMAICGGVNCLLSPHTFVVICQARMLSPSCQCQAFCDTADGYVRGEGCGIVILKSYKKALQDGNKIWATLKTGINQDGHVAQPITAPSGDQQEKLLERVYHQYNIDPASLQYIECHGTGTTIGDAIEVNSLGRFIKSHRQSPETQVKQERQYLGTSDQGHGENQNVLADEEIQDNAKTLAKENSKCKWKHEPIYIGSVKTNIGHLEAAAGIAGLIKVLLMMENGKLVRSLHVKQDKSNLKRTIRFEEYGLDVPLDVISWHQNENGERISCVNSFGFGGSNSHAIVIQKSQGGKLSEESRERKIKLIALSAPDKSSLQKSMVALQTDLSENNFNLKDISVTSLYFRDHLAFKTLLFGFNTLEIQTQIENKVRKIDEIETPKAFKLIFVFCGVGTTWTGMCKEMMETESVFRNTVYRIDEYLEPYTGFKLSDMFQEKSLYSDPVLCHTAIFCTQVALFLLWQSWGLHPDAVIGQSVGEVAAAFASGALSLPDAVKVIYFRSQCLAKVTSGSMMVVGNVSHTLVQNLCRDQQNRVNIAVYNSPTSFTLSGDADAMEKIKGILEAEKVNNNKLLIKPLSVPCAYHSHHVETCTGILETQLKNLQCRSKTVDIFSTVTGNIASGNEFQTVKYWTDNVQKPVQLMEAVSNASSLGVTNVFLEIGPKPVLRAHLRKIMSEIDMSGMSLTSMDERKETASIYSALSRLYELGADIKWENIAAKSGSPVAIPRCVFNRTKRLLIPARHKQLLHGLSSSSSDSHMFVMMTEIEKRTFLFTVSKKTTPFVYDHYFFGKVLMPGATFIEAAFEVGQRISNLTCCECNISVNFVHTFLPQSDQENTIEIEVTKDIEEYSYHFVAKTDVRLLCYGTISRREDQGREHLDMQPILERCKAHKTRATCYTALEKFHFKYGKTMSPIQQAWSAETECLVELILPESVISQRNSTHLHPVILDGMLQGVASMTSFDSESSETYLPKSIGSVVINRQPTTRMFSYSHILKHDQTGTHFNCLLVSETGRVIAEIHDFFSSKISAQDPRQSVSFYSIKWRGIDPPKHDHVSMQNKQIKEGIVVFGSKRFNDIYRKVDDSPAIFIDLSEYSLDNEASFHKMFSPGKCSDISSIIFAPCYTIEHVTNKTGLSIFGKSRLLFLTFSKLLQTLMYYKKEIPVYVVTENIASPFQNTISSEPNVIGAELWGMVRSAMLEDRHSLCCLVDITLSIQNARILRNIVHRETLENNELMIKDGFVFLKALEGKVINVH